MDNLTGDFAVPQVKNNQGKDNFSLETKYLMTLPAGAVYLATSMAGFMGITEAVSHGVSQIAPGTASFSTLLAAAASSVAVAAIVNLKPSDLKATGSSIKNFGQAIFDGVSDLGQRLGLVKEGEAPMVKATEVSEKGRSYWGATAVDSLRLALATPLALTTLGTVASALSIPFASSGHVSAAVLQTGVLGAASVVSGLGILGLSKLRNNIVNPGKFDDAVKTAQADKPIEPPQTMRGRAVRDDDYQPG